MDVRQETPNPDGGHVAGGPVDPSRWRHPARRAALTLAILAAFAWTLSGPALDLARLVPANDWGSDWRWLADGLDRLAAGLPLNHPEFVAAPFRQLDPGPTYTWSLHPPWNAALLAPMLLVPPGLREVTWTVAMAATLLLAVWIAWPRGIWWGTSLLIAAAALGPPAAGLWIGLVDQVHYANPNALVLLGLALVWIGRREARTALIVAGLVLAAVKVVPAVGLTAWLLASRAGRAATLRALGTAAGIVAALTVPIVLLDPGVLADTVAVAANLVPWDGPGNLAPQVRLASLLGPWAAWLSWVAGSAVLALVLLRRLDGPGGFVLAAGAPLLMTPQLWVHWLLIPMLAGIASLGGAAAFRDLDRQLRQFVERGGSARAAVAAPVGSLGGSRPVRALFAAAGTIFLGLGLLGIVLPVLPTTPFLLLAAASYARASSRLHAWLLANPRVGPVIRNWQQSRSLPPGVKPRALAAIGLSFSISIVAVDDPVLRIGLAAGALLVLAYVGRLPSGS